MTLWVKIILINDCNCRSHSGPERSTHCNLRKTQEDKKRKANKEFIFTNSTTDVKQLGKENVPQKEEKARKNRSAQSTTVSISRGHL